MLKRLPKEQRHMIAVQMWFGTEIKKVPIHLLPFKMMFEDANNNATGKKWKTIIDGNTQIKKMSEKKFLAHKKLLESVYPKHDPLYDGLQDFFVSKDFKWFEKNIVPDCVKAMERDYKKHMDFWLE